MRFDILLLNEYDDDAIGWKATRSKLPPNWLVCRCDIHSMTVKRGQTTRTMVFGSNQLTLQLQWSQRESCNGVIQLFNKPFYLCICPSACSDWWLAVVQGSCAFRQFAPHKTGTHCNKLSPAVRNCYGVTRSLLNRDFFLQLHYLQIICLLYYPSLSSH